MRSARSSWRPGSGDHVDAALHARVSGSGNCAIALLHGLTASNAVWGADFDVLAEACRVVIPDLLGFGSSPRPAGGYDADSHALAVEQTLAELAAPSPIVVAGHSLGALIALRLAARRPELIAGVVAIAPPVYRSGADARRRIGGLGPFARTFALDTRWARVACRVMCHARPVAARLAAALQPGRPAELARASVEHSWPSYSQTLQRVVLDGPARSDLVTCSVPVSILVGDHDRVVDLDFLRELSGTAARLELDVVVGGEHDLLFSAPDRCVDAIRAMSASWPSR